MEARPHNLGASNIFGLLPPGASPVPPGAGLYTILGNDFQATLRAIAQSGKTEILSRPSILARNNQQATITLGQEVPLITSTRFDTLGNQINSVTYQSVGIILQVTPFITAEGLVEMIVSPQTSQLADQSQWVPISSGPSGSVSAPVINTARADTVVVVPDGQTVVIGGLMENEKVTSVTSKIPLGDIPFIGNAFKRTIKAYTKTELIIFLTPHVVQQPGQLVQLSATERARTCCSRRRPFQNGNWTASWTPCRPKRDCCLDQQERQSDGANRAKARDNPMIRLPDATFPSRMRQRAPLVNGVLLAVWLMVVFWQGLEHWRVTQGERTALINRSRDIATTLSVVIRSQRHFGGIISQERLESALNDLARSGELLSVALLECRRRYRRLSPSASRWT